MRELNKTDFQPLNPEQQRAIIRAVKNRNLPKVTFLNASALTDDWLSNHLSFHYVTELDLRGCLNIQGQFFVVLEKEALALEYLNLAESGIKMIANQGYFNTASITLSTLKGLNVNNAESLREYTECS